MKDDILMTIFGGGTLDWEMLEKCEYDFEDIYEDMKSFCSLEDIDFSSILLGAIDLYRYHIDKEIEEKIKETESDLKELENYSDMYNGNINDEYVDKIHKLKEKLEKLQSLDIYEDMEDFINYLDTHIYINDEEKREIYRTYLSKEIEKENELIGFCYLDLDQ